MEMLKKITIMFLAIILFVVMMAPSVAFATSKAGEGYIDFATSGFSNESLDNYEFNKEPGKMTTEEAERIRNAGLPNVHVEQASQFVEEKGFDIISFLQRFVQPFAIIIFIFCALLSLIGAFGNASWVGKGIVGMAIAIIMYAVVLYAPELLDFFASWVSS